MRRFLVIAFASLLVLPALADPCQLNFISHGTFRDAGGCTLFEDDLGNLYEVLLPRGSFRDGRTGTIHAQWETDSACSTQPALRVCTFTADYQRRINGTLVFRQFIECPGYIIDTPNQDYRIQNCQDFGTALCDPANLGRSVQADVAVETGVSICLGLARSDVLEFRFLP